MYTHSEYDDCWTPFFDRLKTHCSFEFDKYYIFSYAVNEKVDDKFQHIAYNEADTYTDRLFSCLKQIDTEYCLFQHEDMILYDDIHPEYFQECLDAIAGARDFNVDFVKLHKSGGVSDISPESSYPIEGSDILKRTSVDFEYIFSIQATIWKTKKLLELVENNSDFDIWELETKGQQYCRDNSYDGLYTNHKDDRQRGRLHWDSVVWPYMATAIYRGAWSTIEYPIELNKLFREYNINASIRGLWRQA
jgi:hypothetical protein